MKIIKPGTIYSVDEPEYCGVMPIRSEIEVLSADNPGKSTIGWICEIVREPIFIIENNERLSLDNFKAGLKVRVLTLIGVLEMTTGVDLEFNSIIRYAETENSITLLDATEDGFLFSDTLINKELFYFI